MATNVRFELDLPLRGSVKQWLILIRQGPPRTIDFCANKKADVVPFADGFSPDPRDHDRRPDWIGAVLFDRRSMAPLQFTEVVPLRLKKTWLDRKTQITQ